MKPPKTTALLSALACSALIAACGGTAESSGFVSGTLSGLQAGLQATLRNNGGDDLVVKANGPFTFPTKLPSLGEWSITVASQPTNQFCTVSRPTGVIPTDGQQANVTTIACAANSLAVNVTGLAAGKNVVLTNTATTTNTASTAMTASANGLNSFSGILAGATTYSVVVTTQPTGQTCTLSNATGTITAGAQSQVSLNCV